MATDPRGKYESKVGFAQGINVHNIIDGKRKQVNRLISPNNCKIQKLEVDENGNVGNYDF